MRCFVLLFVCLLLCGCVATDRYKACLGDSACSAEMNQAQQGTYVFTKTAVSGIPFPSIPDLIALVMSNIAAFGIGVWKGGKKKVSVQ